MSSMYGDRAAYYDLLYKEKSYAQEAEFLHERMAAAGIPDGAGLPGLSCEKAPSTLSILWKSNVSG